MDHGLDYFYSFEITRENAFFWSITSEQLVGCCQPVLAVRKGIEDFNPQCFSFVVQQMPSSHYF